MRWFANRSPCLPIPFRWRLAPGATFDTVRPNQVLAAFVRRGSGDYEIEVISRQAWNDIGDKTLRGLPDCVYYRPTYPNGRLLFNRVPTEANTVFIDMEKPIEEVLTLDTTIGLPSEYALAIRYNVAILLAPEYEKDVPPAVAKTAEDAMMNIERRNVANDMVGLTFDPMLLPGTTFDRTATGAGGGGIIVLDGDGNEFIV